MPVIIDQLDLVDTQPDPPRESTASAPRPAAPSVGQIVAALRVTAARMTRSVAD